MEQELLQLLPSIGEKMLQVINRTGAIIPYTSDQGKFVDQFATKPSWWTNGFWPGYLLNLYELTNNQVFLDSALVAIEQLDQVLFDTELSHHDVGFMWHLSAGKHYQLTKDLKSRNRVLTAAKLLASRFDISGGFIVAWNNLDRQSWSIIDTLMNLPLLWFATEETTYDRYKKVALAHGYKALENFIRPDGSVEHIVVFDTETGEKINTLGGQGYTKGSSWSRGQSWAIYGFTELFRSSKDPQFLEAAKKVAHYFQLAASQTGYLPLLDFRAPASPVLYDSTAGAIAASGLISLSELVPESEKSLYLNGAINLLEALRTQAYEQDSNIDYLLSKGSEAYGSETFKGRHHISIIYGDYYFLEALMKLERTVK